MNRAKWIVTDILIEDEEIGGEKGMMKFVQTQEFQSMNVGFSLDEGIASSDELFKVFYAERSVWSKLTEMNRNYGGALRFLLPRSPFQVQRNYWARLLAAQEHFGRESPIFDRQTDGFATSRGLEIGK